MTPSKKTVLRGLVTVGVAAAMLVTVSVGAGAQTALEQTSEKLVRPMPAPSDVAAPPADAVTAASGLATKVITPGKGTAKPGPQDTVTVHYTGWTANGAMFDSSYARGKTSTYSLTRVIPGFSEALQLMVVGEKRRAWIPETLAYKGAEGKPKGMLVFDVELVGFTEAPVTPPDVAEPPADAPKTKSGLAYKVLRPGTGQEKPKSSTTVTVHYSGWTTDGKMFDSSVVNGKPATFGLNQVIKGWTEGVQLMVEGEKTRFWIPSKLAYDGAPDRPQGMLVFDVELIKIEK